MAYGTVDSDLQDIKGVLNDLCAGVHLSKAQAYQILTAIGQGRVNSFQIASFLTCFQMRPIAGVELAGFRAAMIDLATPIDFSDYDTIDLCGTGGDGKDTFNISTISSFVVAGAGYKVAKHGNYGVSSGCGSSNVLEHLGYKFTNDQEILRRYIETGNFCYMHAPLFHPAMRHVGPIRQAMKIKTFFNMLGPLLNPSQPKRQLTGVYSPSLLGLYQEVFEDMGIEYAVLHSEDGYDEISLTSAFHVFTKDINEVVTPNELGLPLLAMKDLYGGHTVEEAAKIFVSILKGDGTDAQNNVVSVNAGYAIQRFKPDVKIEDCINEARESILSGSAYTKLKVLIQ